MQLKFTDLKHFKFLCIGFVVGCKYTVDNINIYVWSVDIMPTQDSYQVTKFINVS